MASIIYNLNSNDKTLILDTRAQLVQPFVANNWMDLRLGIMISATKQSDPNDPTGLGEVIGAGEDNNHFYLGFKSSDGLYPPVSNFFGLSTKDLAHLTSGASLVDGAGVEVDLWSTADTKIHGFLSNGVSLQATPPPAISNIRFQNTLSGGTYTGYATLIILQMTRQDPSSKQVDVMGCCMTTDAFNTVNFLTDTSVAAIRAATAAAAFVQFFGSFAFASVPNALYAYWPFNNSRLRIHDYVLEKYS